MTKQRTDIDNALVALLVDSICGDIHDNVIKQVTKKYVHKAITLMLETQLGKAYNTDDRVQYQRYEKGYARGYYEGTQCFDSACINNYNNGKKEMFDVMIEKLREFLKNYENSVIITDADGVIEDFKNYMQYESEN